MQVRGVGGGRTSLVVSWAVSAGKPDCNRACHGVSWRRLLKPLGGGAGGNTSLTLEFQYQARPLRPRY